MWGGEHVALDDYLDLFEREEDLLGLSTYMDYEYFEDNNSNLQEKPYYNKVKLIEENNKHWKRINVEDEAITYFNYEITHSVDYSGFLINHDQQLAVNLENYYNRSKFYIRNRPILVAVDLIPVLTETGDGSRMAMLEGVSAETTENLFSRWCGDLLQISDNVPDGYEIIPCCFVEIWNRANYCYYNFGKDDKDFVLDSDDKRYEAVQLKLFDNKRGPLRFVKAKKTDKGLLFETEFVDPTITFGPS
jgi:hypothetical protein